MKYLRIFMTIFLIAALITACVKDELVFNDNLVVDHLDPSFALPLAETTLNLGNLEETYDSESFVFNEAEETFSLIYPTDLFEYSAQNLAGLPNQDISNSFSLGAPEAAAFSLLPTGTSASYSWEFSELISTPNGESLDSIQLDGGALEIDMSSSFQHDLLLDISIPSLTNNGMAYSTTISIDYQGSSPVTVAESLDLTGYILDLTDNGTTSNEITVETNITFTHSGTAVNAGDELSYELHFDLSSFQAIYGYLGQRTEIFAEDTQTIKLFEDVEGVLHFENPSIELFIENSAGIPVEVDITTIFAPENVSAQTITGPDLENIPIIMGAAFPGEITTTEHTITNQGTTPALSEVMDEGPFRLIYSAESTTNPNGVQQNFILDTSKVACRANIVLPIYGYADNFAYTDTLDLDLEKELGLDDSDNENLTADDISKVTLRLLVDNGLPVDIGTQIYYLDSNNVVLDSLFSENQVNNIIQSGLVDFSLSESDPDFGRVTTSTRTVTDVEMTSAKLNKLIDEHSAKVVLKGIAFTNSASSGELVRIYPEYNFRMKLSAKIDTNINLSE